MREVCVLEDGRRVRYTLKKRSRDPFYLVVFNGTDGRAKERSTGERGRKRALDAALAIIREEYRPVVAVPNPTWDEAIGRMVEQMRADDLRPKTIEQYLIVVNHLRRAFPTTTGPAEITPAMASRFKAIRRAEGVAVRTIRGNLDNLGIVYNKWWMKECRLLTSDPFADVDPPKADKPSPRIVAPDEAAAFLGWLSGRWGGWRLPLLFLHVKGLIGCRITELASARSRGLKDGRIEFEAVATKGRKRRVVKLPAPVFEELRAKAGPTYVFEAFSEELRRLHTGRGRRQHAARVRPYAPERLKDWVENQANLYFEENPKAERFKLHNFRGTAMSRAKMAGVSYEDAAIAFGCNPETMRQHYLALDEIAITDRVMDEVQGRRGGEAPDSDPETT